MSYHVWCPGLFGFKGGIQVYLASFLEALQSLQPGSRCVALVKNDTRPPGDAGPALRVRVAGWLPRRVRSAGYALLLVAEALLGGPDLLVVGHLHFAPVALWLRRLTGVRYWVLVYGMEAWEEQPRGIRRALAGADLILAIGEHTRGRLIRANGLDPERVALLPPTFAPGALAPGPRPAHLLARLGLRPDQPVILTVSRLAEAERYKGYDQILAALPAIREAVPDAHYVLVGRGADRERVEREIARLGLADCVSLAGFVPDEELGDYYRLCDVFAMPSRREGFGIVYVEAMACGKPVLGGDRDGAVDALRGGALGALVDPDDVPEIAAALVRLLRGEHHEPLVHRPAELRRAAIEAFGPESFRRTLRAHLERFGPRAASVVPSEAGATAVGG